MHPFYLTTKLCDRALIRVKKKSIIAMVFSEIDIIVILALINEVEGLLITMG